MARFFIESIVHEPYRESWVTIMPPSEITFITPRGRSFYVPREMYIPRLGIYVPRLGIYVPRVGMYVSRLGTYFFHEEGQTYMSGGHNFFYEMIVFYFVC